MNLRVLVVGDNPTGAYAERLRQQGWEVEHVGFAQAAGADIAFRIHAAVIDLSTRPELGVRTAWALRSIPIPATDLLRHPNLPVLFVGGDDRWRDRIRLRVAGASFVSESEVVAALAEVERALHPPGPRTARRETGPASRHPGDRP